MVVRTFKTLALVAALCGLPALASAQQNFNLTGVNGVHANGVYIGPYYGSTPGTPSLDLICDDYSHTAFIGMTWWANVTNVLDVGPSSLTRWNVESLYVKAVWLAMRFYDQPTNQWAGIHAAIWNTFTPGTPNPSNWTNEAYWAGQANAHYSDLTSGQLKYWYVVTPTDYKTNSNSTQEFLTYVTPEPATIILLGTGMVGLMLFTGLVRRTAT